MKSVAVLLILMLPSLSILSAQSLNRPRIGTEEFIPSAENSTIAQRISTIRDGSSLAQGWIHIGPFDQRAQHMVADPQNRLFVVMEDNGSEHPGTWLRLKASTNLGSSWSDELSLWSTAGNHLLLPNIAYGSGYVFVHLRNASSVSNPNANIVGMRLLLGGGSGSFYEPPFGAQVERARFCTDAEVYPSNTYLYAAFINNQSTGAKRLMFSRSLNNGSSWSSPIELAEVFPSYVTADVGIDWGGSTTSNTLYVAYLGTGTNQNRILVRRSTNLGASWGAPVVAYNDTRNKFGPVVAASGNSVLIVVQLAASSTNDDIVGIWSTDQGNTWASYPIASSSVSERMPWVAHDLSGNFYVTYKRGNQVFKQQGIGTPQVGNPVQISSTGAVSNDDYTNVVGLSNGYLAAWVATSNGLDIACGDVVSSVSHDSQSLPQIFALSQNHPNPFNPSTTIQYALPVSGVVTLTIYDQHGREVKTVVNEMQDAGHKAVTWNSTNNAGIPVASGVYFYRLQAGSFVETKKLVLLR